jgi:hypothetical protein
MPAKGADELQILLDLFEQAETKIKNAELITSEGVLISMGDFFKPCPSRAKAGFKKSPSG